MMIVKNKTYIKPELELKALRLEGMIATTPGTDVTDQPYEGGDINNGSRHAKEGFNFDWSEL